MKLNINNQIFMAELADTKAAAELRGLLPLTLTLQDYADNEKVTRLPRRLTQDDVGVGRIQAGDILLWQGDSIVVFYESFDTTYRYTRLGKIINAGSLKTVLGRGAVSIQFETAE